LAAISAIRTPETIARITMGILVQTVGVRSWFVVIRNAFKRSRMCESKFVGDRACCSRNQAEATAFPGGRIVDLSRISMLSSPDCLHAAQVMSPLIVLSGFTADRSVTALHDLHTCTAINSS
jgi:hypothetical protein